MLVGQGERRVQIDRGRESVITRILRLTHTSPTTPPASRASARAQRWRGDDFGVGAVALPVHQQLAGVGAGDAEFQGTVGEEALALFGVPDLVCYPAGGVGG